MDEMSVGSEPEQRTDGETDDEKSDGAGKARAKPALKKSSVEFQKAAAVEAAAMAEQTIANSFAKINAQKASGGEVKPP